MKRQVKATDAGKEIYKSIVVRWSIWKELLQQASNTSDATKRKQKI